jgi:hypothetical protein
MIKGSQRVNKRNENGEYHKRIYGILEYIFFYLKVLKERIKRRRT